MRRPMTPLAGAQSSPGHRRDHGLAASSPWPLPLPWWGSSGATDAQALSLNPSGDVPYKPWGGEDRTPIAGA